MTLNTDTSADAASLEGGEFFPSIDVTGLSSGVGDSSVLSDGFNRSAFLGATDGQIETAFNINISGSGGISIRGSGENGGGRVTIKPNGGVGACIQTNGIKLCGQSK